MILAMLPPWLRRLVTVPGWMRRLLRAALSILPSGEVVVARWIAQRVRVSDRTHIYDLTRELVERGVLVPLERANVLRWRVNPTMLRLAREWWCNPGSPA